MAVLTQEKRDKMSRGDFAGPGPTDFPIGDETHAKLAIGGATRSYNAGNITAEQKNSIQAKARARLGRYKSSVERG